MGGVFVEGFSFLEELGELFGERFLSGKRGAVGVVGDASGGTGW